MKILSILFFSIVLLFGEVYYSKVQPYEIRNISSNVSGLVIYSDENNLGKILSNEPYIKIDSDLDIQELTYIKEKLEYLANNLKLSEQIWINLEKATVKKRENYKKIESLKIKSQVEKNREFYDLIASENLLLNTKKEIQNFKIQITDLKLREAKLKRIVDDKNLRAKGYILYDLLVKSGQVVNISTPLAIVADIFKAKLTIYLSKEEVLDIEKKIVYLDGVKTNYKVNRVLNIADSKNISKYMAQIIIKSPKIFSKLVKVELKDE